MRIIVVIFFFFSSRRRHTRSYGDWSSDVCSSDLFLVSSEFLVKGKRASSRVRNYYRRATTTGTRVVRGERAIESTACSVVRSEESRVGKEWRCRWGREQ